MAVDQASIDKFNELADARIAAFDATLILQNQELAVEQAKKVAYEFVIGVINAEPTLSCEQKKALIDAIQPSLDAADAAVCAKSGEVNKLAQQIVEVNWAKTTISTPPVVDAV